MFSKYTVFVHWGSELPEDRDMQHRTSEPHLKDLLGLESHFTVEETEA